MIFGALTGIVHSRNLDYKFNTYLGTNADKDLPNWSINFSDIVSFSKFRNYNGFIVLAFTSNLHYILSAILDTNSIDIILININMSRHLFNQTNAHIVSYALRAKSVYLFDSNFEQDRTSFKSCWFPMSMAFELLLIWYGSYV